MTHADVLERAGRRSTCAALLVAGVLLGACGGEEGQAVPGAGASSTVVSPGEGGGELAQVNACDLLTDADAATVSKAPEEQPKSPGPGETSACAWSDSIDVHPDDGMTFGISIRPSQAVAAVSVWGEAKMTDGDVAGRKAKQVAENGGHDGSCLLSFAAEDGRVDIIVESNDTERSCAAADRVATIIEPKLPKA